ncbi:recombinase family protein [Actinoplanes sp. CA-051413]|uniref:recombinase family protein n=1 Tax=Actinoplanes sp. CA-051413 TaxID=3239899 RepID=UPI003D994E01
MTRSWGYDATGRHLVPSEVTEIRLALIDGLLGGKKAGAVVADLRNRGVPTVTGAAWTESALRRFARYPRLAGLRRAQGELVAAPWPAIITRRQHEQLVRLLGDPAPKRPADNQPKYLLSGGLLVCGSGIEADRAGDPYPCGKTLYTQPSGSVTRGYICRSGGPSYGCGRTRISGPAVEAVVATRALTRLSSPTVLGRLRRSAGAAGAHLDELLTDLDDRLREAGAEHARGELGPQALQWLRDRTKQERDALRERARQAERLAKLPDPAALATWWTDAEVREKRELISLVLHHVVVHRAPRRGNVPFDPERLEFLWK